MPLLGTAARLDDQGDPMAPKKVVTVVRRRTYQSAEYPYFLRATQSISKDIPGPNRVEYAAYFDEPGYSRTDMDSASEDVTLLLIELTNGDEDAASKLIPLVYDELHRLAKRYMRRERSGHTLQTTALVNEAYLRLVEQHSVRWQSRAHFFAIAAQMMRRILIDHARNHLCEKRGGGQKMVALDEALVFSPERSMEFLKLEESLVRLAKFDPRQSKIVELRFFGGLTVEETAEVLRISPKTVKRDWSVAKAWLHGDLRANHDATSGKMGNR